jgi:hypothetical protein
METHVGRREFIVGLASVVNQNPPGVVARIFEELGETTLQRLFAFELRRREYAAAARISAGERPNSITAERFNMPRWSDSNFGMREENNPFEDDRGRRRGL